GVHEPAAAAAAAAVVAWHLVPRGRREQLRFALRGFRHRTASPGLPPALAEALYGQPLCLAVSRLEAFAACPFRHFAAYGLGLREPDGPDITAAQRGSLLHDALAAFVREQGTDMERWRQLDDDAAAAAMANVVSRLLAEPRYAAWQRRAARRAQVLEAARTLAAAAVVLTRHARYGAFVPRFVEWVFGEEGQPEVAVDLGDGRRVWLRGRIDRIDTVEADGRLAFRIIDYKSSPRGIDFTRLAHGLQIQLPVYAAVVMAQAGSLFGRDAEPASMLYLPVVREVKLTSAPDAPAAARLAAWKAMRASGLLVDDRALVGWHDWRLLQGEATELFKQVYTRQDRLASSADALPAPLWRLVVERAWQHVRSFGRRILDGETAIAPYRIGHEETACRTCPYRAVCQMDPRWDAGLYRRLPSFSKRRLGEWAAEEGTP
ncbi:PD-(D/E)XK nuclease family protein, partial [Alicyclobacillus cellulosilyticus]|uniref:PD-(D/E)XK nuclease family protein n=1 Tax=Alicyclobacillus cellulosilyticus TaxID=1003997 RepID=UPI00166B17CE